MIYPENFESKIKFDKIRQLVKSYCLSDMGRELVDKMNFSSDSSYISEQLKETHEFMNILQVEDSFPGDHFKDARPFLQKIRVEGLFLEIAEMVALKLSLESLSAIVRFFKGKEERYPILSAKAGCIHLFPFVQQRLDTIVSKHGTIKDTASPELNDIRHRLQRKQAGISKRMQSLLQQAQSEGWADKESAIAIRDGRMVIPVPSAYKRKINGIVHDESATGKTSYIEPAEIVETNNEIRELELEEKREIMRILRKFADELRPYIDDLLPGYDFLAYIDFIRGKAAFSNYIEAVVPAFNDNAEMFWYQARHPLLWLSLKNTDKKLIPLNIEVYDEQRIILISGPNAGGKSVCLQTAGLLQYMFQCGLPVPVSEASKFGIFGKILIDIGDEQSIENDLSTYSSHLINMKNFLRYGSDDTLVLIDEFGTGTEPMLGGAIAEAILSALNRDKVRGVITTHYTNLKHLAAETPGIANGAMLYDNHRMLPLFELKIGKPGSSFAFEIAKKIGLPKEILEDAAAKVGEDHINYDKHLKDIARDKRYWEEKRRKIHENEKRLDEVVEKYSNELSEASRIRKEIIREAQQKAQEIIADANAAVEKTIREIRENQAEKEKTREIRRRMEEEKQRLLSEKQNEEEERIRKKIEKLKNREKNRKEKKQNQPETSPQHKEAAPIFQKGDYVKLPNNAIGEILEIDDKNAVVALGQLHTKVKVSQLQKASATQAKRIARPQIQASYANIRENISQKRMTFKPDIDLRGMRGDEALQRVISFLDEAIMLGYRDIRILHGTGTGALRQLIRQYLSTNPVVATYADEQVQLGGTGITVVQLDI
ncbi:MAG: Smr/MutS family protein [Odoribacter sp.]|nr:Smr/MutS family protein [Odoribacter sp.]MDY3034473.1 Smr/MutS family protein [Odoribacter sp.]